MPHAESGTAAPSEAQLEIINIVWDQGQATVGQIWKVLAKRRPLSRNTVSTMVTRLEEKGWLRHRVVGGTFLYLGHTSPRRKSCRDMVHRLVDAAFQGSAEGLVLTLLEGGRLSAAEVERIKAMVEKTEVDLREAGPMNVLLRIYPGDAWALMSANVLVQVTVVILTAWLLARLGSRWNAAWRHSICLVALVCVLASPLLAWVMQAGGIALVTLRPPAPTALPAEAGEYANGPRPAIGPHRDAGPAAAHGKPRASAGRKSRASLRAANPPAASSPDILAGTRRRGAAWSGSWAWPGSSCVGATGSA